MSTPSPHRSLRDAGGVEPLGAGRYGVELADAYTVMDHPHGGYLQCVMASAAVAAASTEGATHLHATAVTTSFMNAPSPGFAELRTNVRRVGRGASFVHVELVQGAVVMSEALVTLGTLREGSAPRYQDPAAPEIEDLADCPRSTGGDELNIMRVVDLRLDPRDAGWRDGEYSGRGEVRAWLRLDDGDGVWDPWSLHFASDVMPPATFPLGSSGWVPTLQLTSYVHRVPDGEWLRARQWCAMVADGWLDERCDLFDERGELVASASQLAMVRFPGGR